MRGEQERWMYGFHSGNLKANPFDALFFLCAVAGPGSLYTQGERGRFKLAIMENGKDSCLGKHRSISECYREPDGVKDHEL